MAPFFDEQHIHDALQVEALPALERVAANPNVRDRTLRRFDRDEPPPYESSTESESEDPFHRAWALGSGSVLQKFESLMDAPLDENEQLAVAQGLHEYRRAYEAGERFRAESRVEEKLLDSFCRNQGCNNDARKFLSGRAGQQRYHVIIRRNIRRRWQKLGVWNPQWGIPGRVNGQPNDDTSRWKWRWQRGRSAAKWHVGPDATSLNSQHPNTRAVRLRHGVHRGENNPPPPRSRLPKNATAAQAESFIISRPWFTYFVETEEEAVRFDRIPRDESRFHRDPIAKPVVEWWKGRGDWKKDWHVPSDDRPVPGWKWRHESPSPEPEDLTPLNTMEIDFTPSEIDALEAIPAPTPSPDPLPPDHLWDLGSKPGSLFYAVERDVEGRLSPPSHDASAPLPQRRRSARIAARKPNPAPTPPASGQPIRPKLPKGKEHSAARPVPARPPPTETPKTKGRPRKPTPKKKGRPRKPNAPGKPPGKPPSMSKASASSGKRGKKANA